MSHFTQISATLINEKYYKGHSQAAKSNIKAMVMLKVGKWGGLCTCVCLCARVWILACVIRKQVEVGDRGSSLEHAVLEIRTGFQHLCGLQPSL